ncbi:EAL domain-containing protein [Clostridioides sp. ZZV15-6383]|uniref:EAL domain-containing protein n=1 Tax=unclassified Clostridioides TaxID=2635829 RepID=UPI001D0FC750|nr:EAL domain-containing protein [Clostridioides sp. ZZV14-6345]MCC0700553.1 EAL domain-containing protein [Clostridioides sp. ZZV15-6383]
MLCGSINEYNKEKRFNMKLTNPYINILKLDRAFFTEKDENNNEKIVISNVIRMAKELKMKVISEEVETVSQVEFLKQIGCDMVQGYLFSKPIPVKEFEKIAFKKEENNI